MTVLDLKIPESFFEEEIKDGFTVSKKRKQIWAVELDLLNQILQICNKYGFRVYADSGTALGAMRHKGFIPWDDDIDLVMFREDYKKLCEIAPRELSAPYFFQTEHTDPGSMRGHAQLRNSDTTAFLNIEIEKRYPFNQGIFIDIFPLDCVPVDQLERQSFFEEIKSKREKAFRYSRMTDRYISNTKSLKGIAKAVVHSLKKKNKSNPYYQDFEEYIQKYNNKKTGKVTKLFFRDIDHAHILDTDWFREQVIVPFEFMNIPVPCAFDEVLTEFFGDWRTPVRAASIHGDTFFDTERSYLEYLNGIVKPDIQDY